MDSFKSNITFAQPGCYDCGTSNRYHELCSACYAVDLVRALR